MRSLNWRMAALLLVMACTAGAVGCQKAAWGLVQIVRLWTPEEEVEAQYALEGKSVLVLVDTKDSQLASDWPHLNQAMADAINKVLSDHNACGPLVSARNVETVRKTEPQFTKWSVVQVGQHFNVDRVIHIEMAQFRLRDSAGSNVYQGYAQAAVRVVDIDAGQQVWPQLSSARLIDGQTQPDVEAEGMTEQQEILIDGFADKVARMFFTYKKEELSIRPKVK
jgi:hypothetical protein